MALVPAIECLACSSVSVANAPARASSVICLGAACKHARVVGDDRRLVASSRTSRRRRVA